MSEPSRAERRRQARGESTPPPNDPMRNIYIGFAALIVVVFAIFGGIRWNQQHQLDVATATPSPGPNASSKPIALEDAPVPSHPGTSIFPPGDTKQGGQGAPIDGINCESEGAELHVHSHLAIFDHGKQIRIPQYIGFVQDPKTGSGCLYWIHTHNETGILHVESPQISPPSGGQYALGLFFDIWGEPLTNTQVATFKGPVTAYVNGALYTGDLRAIPLLAHQEITLEIGTPLVPAPYYVFPPAD